MYDVSSGSSDAGPHTRPTAARFFPSVTHDEALARLHFLFEQRRRAGMLLGEPGSGKSLLLSVFAEQCRREGAAVVQQNLTAIDEKEFPALLARGLGVAQTSGRGVTNVWQAIADRLAECRYQRIALVVLLDDADHASQAVLDQVARLAYIDGSTHGPVTVILAAQHAGLVQIPGTLKELVELRIDLDPWDAAEIAEYIASQFSGGMNFSLKAIQRIHALSGGIPGRVQRLAELALVAAAADEMDLINEAAVDAVHDQLTLPAAG